MEVPSQDDLKDDMSTKPAYIQTMAEKNRARGGGIAPVHYKIPDKMRTVTAVDEGVGMIFEKLKNEGLLENTIVIFAGDNGYFVSEHGGLHDKRKAYEEAIRIPLLMWNPFQEQPRKIDSLVLNIDLAPYICDLAGIEIPDHMHGESWQPILDGKSKGRKGFLYEYYKENEYRPTGGFGGTPTILAYRTKDWKYVTYPEAGFTSELYDLTNDPKELYNLVDDKSYARVLSKLDKSFYKLLKEIDYTPPTRIRGKGQSIKEIYTP
jgi:N-acetylglucosamine-6-sulfatase